MKLINTLSKVQKDAFYSYFDLCDLNLNDIQHLDDFLADAGFNSILFDCLDWDGVDINVPFWTYAYNDDNASIDIYYSFDNEWCVEYIDGDSKQITFKTIADLINFIGK